MSLSLDQFGIHRLSSQERRELLELLWESLADQDASLPPDTHVDELNRRLAQADAHPEDG